MAITINALTTGTGGLETTADASGSFSFQSDGSTIATVTSSGFSVTGTFDAGSLQVGGSDVVVDTDIGSTVQAYDANTTKNDVANTFTANQTINADLTVDTNTLYVDSTNNRVGIGTSSPNYHMTINGGASATSIQLANTATGTGPANGLLIYQDGVNSRIQNIEAGVLTLWTSNTERMRIDSSGNVGIGTNSPSVKFQVNDGSASSNATMKIMNTANANTNFGCAIQFANQDPTYYMGQIAALRTNSAANYSSYLTFSYSSNTTITEGMRLDSNGNVGIGTSSPSNKLEVNGNIGIGTGSGITTVSSGLAINNATATNYPGLEIQTAGTTRFYINTNNAASYITTVGSIPMVFSTNTTERMRIDSSGNVFVGTTATQNGATGVVYSKTTAKAWVTFTGFTGAILSSFNVSSVTRVSAGVYTVNFTSAMPNANYSSFYMAQPTVTNAGADTFTINPTTTTVQLNHWEANVQRDSSYSCFVVFGNA